MRQHWFALVVFSVACGPAGTAEAPGGGGGDSGAGSESSEAEPVPSEPDPPAPRIPSAGHVVVEGARLPGGLPVEVEIRDGVVTALGEALQSQGAERVDLGGATLVPGFIDSHVHLAFHYGAGGVADGRTTLARAGIVGGVDLAAPEEALPAFSNGWIAAGPMITAQAGYPTQSWGANGYGREVSGPEVARDTVRALADAGARVIKIPIDGGPALSDAEVTAIVDEAHTHDLLVVAHALSDADATRAAELGADVLAHTPVEPLAESTVEAWKGRAVISTLRAFGASQGAVDNLRRLHEAGATVLYGTDLGNTRVEAIDVEELDLLVEAGLSREEVLAAGTRVPAELWGMEGLGTIAIGQPATFMALADDPLDNLDAFDSPVAVWVDGKPQ